MTVAIAVQGLAQNGDGPKFIDHTGDADLDAFGFVPMAMRDVRGGYVVRVRWRPEVVGWAWLGGVISAGEAAVCGIEVPSVAWPIGEVKGLGSDGGEDGVALGEEGIECAAKAIVVEAGGWDVPEEVGAGVFGPGRDVDEGRGLAQPGGEEKAEDAAV